MIEKPASPISSRSKTRLNGAFTRTTAGSQSLERGMQILRAYRLGVELLTNAELADRTDLPRPTVSRLTRSLVEEGFLDYDLSSRSYRLSPIFLGFSYAFQHAENTDQAISSTMQSLARNERVNVGLALPNLLDMVYVESVRESRRGVFRHAPTGTRFPIELTSGGRAYLSALNPAPRDGILQKLAIRHGEKWPPILSEIEAARKKIKKEGYCVAHWQPGMTAIGTPLKKRNGRIYSLIISFHTPDTLSATIRKHSRILLDLKEDIQKIWHR
ncbi:IclR family transcriptional regulator [Achromobacter sp. F4_2707]|uniref:IclR family transcriptional regulator n=1 Tax=Achromobacter sp. F4_2707 TaxID=3114286 RepID=UPI0039C5B39B